MCLAALVCGVPAVFCLSVIIQSGGRAAQAGRGAIRQGGRGVRVPPDAGVSGLATLQGGGKRAGTRAERGVYIPHTFQRSFPKWGGVGENRG